MNKFFIELAKRFVSKSPKFFRIIKYVAIGLSLLTGIPALLESHGIAIPEAWAAIADKVVSIAAAVGAFIAQLTVAEPEKIATLPATKEEAKK